MNVPQAGFSTNSHLNLEELVVYYHQIQPELKHSWHFINVHHCISFSLRKLKNICRRETFRFFNTLCEKCPNMKFVWSIFSRIRTEYGDLRITSVFSPNTGYFGPKKTHCDIFRSFKKGSILRTRENTWLCL